MPAAQSQPIAPQLIIPRTPYPKWWKDAIAKPINMDDAGELVILAPTPGYLVYVCTIVLTVSGQTNITLNMGVHGQSGAMDFGVTNEPSGIVMAMGNSPMPCGGGGFKITSDGPGIHVGGFITYYYEPEQPA